METSSVASFVHHTAFIGGSVSFGCPVRGSRTRSYDTIGEDSHGEKTPRVWFLQPLRAVLCTQLGLDQDPHDPQTPLHTNFVLWLVMQLCRPTFVLRSSTCPRWTLGTSLLATLARYSHSQAYIQQQKKHLPVYRVARICITVGVTKC